MPATDVLETLKHATQITGFVMVMMLVIEFANVLTYGDWHKRLSKHPWGQYIAASFLGAVPGCLGAFAVVALYSHRHMSLGALVTAMLATMGDESFVMFAMVPKQAAVLHLILFILGIAAGVLTDLLLGKRRTEQLVTCPGFAVHGEHARDVWLSRDQMLRQWRHCSLGRGVLTGVLGILILGTITGDIGPDSWNWLRFTILLSTLAAVLMVAGASEHFLEEHLWRHVALQHIPRIFLWTLGTLLVIHVMTNRLDLESFTGHGLWGILIIACVVGLIPESGPHLMFVTLYAQGTIPISILLANSIVQDGHGMLPLLAHSRRAFFVVKAINMAIALGVGSLALALHY